MNRRKPSFFPGLAPGHGTDCPASSRNGDPIGGTDSKTRFLFMLFAFTSRIHGILGTGFYASRFTFVFSSCFSLLRPVFTGSSGTGFYASRFTFVFSSCFSLLRPVFTGSSERDFTHHVLCFYHSTGGTVGQAKILGKAFVPSFYLNLSFPSQISRLTQPTSHNPSGPYHNPQHVRTAVNPVFYDSYSCKLFPPL